MKLPNGYGSMTKLKRRCKPYAARVTVGWTDDGRQIKKYLGTFRTRREALNALAEYNHGDSADKLRHVGRVAGQDGKQVAQAVQLRGTGTAVATYGRYRGACRAYFMLHRLAPDGIGADKDGGRGHSRARDERRRGN